MAINTARSVSSAHNLFQKRKEKPSKMKLSSIVLISAATAGRIDKCNNIISFLETQGISAENRVHRRIQEFKEVLYPIVKDRAQFCGTEDVNERVEMEELDEVEQRMTFDNVDNKVNHLRLFLFSLKF